MNDAPQVILASASPRRRELLEQIGIHARVQAVDIDESRYPDEPVLSFVQRLAKQKAQAGAGLIKNETGDNQAGLPVLGSDTVVEADGVRVGAAFAARVRQHGVYWIGEDNGLITGHLNVVPDELERGPANVSTC